MALSRGVWGVVVATRLAYADGDSPAKAKQQLGDPGAATKLPGLLTLDGGSLAIPPSALAEGMAASLDTRIDLRSRDVDETGFAQLSGVTLDSATSLGIRLETAALRLPRLDFGTDRIARSFAGEHVESVGLHLTHVAAGHAHLRAFWLGVRVAQRMDATGGIAELGGRLHWEAISLFAGAAAAHLRPVVETMDQHPAYTDGRVVAGAEWTRAGSFEGLSGYAGVDAGTWTDDFAMNRRQTQWRFEAGIGGRATVKSVRFTALFHVLAALGGNDISQFAFSVITSGHQ